MGHHIVCAVVLHGLQRALGRFGAKILIVALGQLLLCCVCAAIVHVDGLMQQGVCANSFGDCEAIWYMVSTEGCSHHAVAGWWLFGPCLHV